MAELRDRLATLRYVAQICERRYYASPYGRATLHETRGRIDELERTLAILKEAA